MNVGSLFSGAGLLDYGLAAAGFEHSWFCEINPAARRILSLRWPGVPIYEDAREQRIVELLRSVFVDARVSVTTLAEKPLPTRFH